MAIVKGGKAFYGDALGILMLRMKAPLIPGNVGNAHSYEFPVRFKIIDLPADWWCDKQGPDEKRLQIYINAAKDLEEEGVKAITSGCGFFAIYQKAAARELKIPLFASPLLMVPMVSRMIGGRRVGIISAGGSHLTQGKFLENVGIDPSIPVAVGGLEDTEEFYKVHVTEVKPEIDTVKFEKEVVDASLALLKKHPDIGAFVFECSDIPPHAHAVARVTGLPVFDFISLAHLVHTACFPRRYDECM